MLIMNKEEKLNEIKTLTKDLCEASNFYLTDIAGLDSQSTLDLEELVLSQIFAFLSLRILFSKKPWRIVERNLVT